ncbi:MAG: hypothetical protein ACWA5W_05535 [Phycisphaerales bacterium]
MNSVVVALMLLGSYLSSIASEIHDQGWGVAVPRIVLVASLPFLSEEQGSGLGPFVLGAQNEVEPSKFDLFVMNELGVDRSGWRNYAVASGESPLGIYSQRLLFVLAKMESRAVITDGTTVKGKVYKKIITDIVRGGHALESDSQWAHSVIYIEYALDDSVAPESVVYGRFKSRRLLHGDYRFITGWRGEEYECHTPTMMRINGMHPQFSTSQERVEYWVNRFLWDSHYRVVADGKVQYSYGQDELALGVSSKDGNVHDQERAVRYRIKETDAVGNDLKVYHTVAQGESPVRFRVDHEKAVIQDSSEELKGLIEDHLSAKFTVMYDQTREEWVPIIKIRSNPNSFRIQPDPISEEERLAFAVGGELPDRLFERKQRTPGFLEGGLIFGGKVSIKLIWNLDSGPYEMTVLSGIDTWWRWGRPNGIDLSRMPPPRDGRERAIELFPRTNVDGATPGEIKRGQARVPQYKDTYKILIRIEPRYSGLWQDFGGLQAKRYFRGTIEFPVENWTVEELRRFIVNGTVPDHAMP